LGQEIFHFLGAEGDNVSSGEFSAVNCYWRFEVD
jgi:hypothetical protein